MNGEKSFKAAFLAKSGDNKDPEVWKKLTIGFMCYVLSTRHWILEIDFVFSKYWRTQNLVDFSGLIAECQTEP